MAIDPRPVPYVVSTSGDVADAPDVALPIALYGAGEDGGSAVESVNGKTGAVTLSADDVGALPDDYTPTWASVTGKPTTFQPAAHAATLVNVAADAANGVTAGNAQVVISALAARIKALEDATP